MKKILDASILVIIPLIMLFGGCMPQVTTQKELVCPKPETFCQPVKWNGIACDSSFDNNKTMDYYYTFEKVKQINTIENEWSLSFIDNKRAVLMFDENNKQKPMIARMIKYDKASMESGMGIPLAGQTGTVSVGRTEKGEGKKDADIVLSISPTDGVIGRADLYEGSLEGNFVSGLTKLGTEINQSEKSWESQPAFSPDGNVLFFASDRIVGFGGTDIWFSVRIGRQKTAGSGQLSGTPVLGEWSEAINCGKIVNTGCNELTPFVNSDGKKLLFASAGHETVGGYDIFECDISDEFWDAVKEKRDWSRGNGTEDIERFFSEPKNMLPPLNTAADELFPSSPYNVDSLLYYSSNQDASKASLISMEGGFDIFVRNKIVLKKPVAKQVVSANDVAPEVKQEKPEEPQVKIIPTYTLTGEVLNAVTLEELNEADVTVKKKQDNTLYKEVKTNKNGIYSVVLEKGTEFEVTAQAKNLFFETATVYVEDIDNLSTLKQDFKIPELLTLRINFPSDVYDVPYRYTLDSNGVETSQTWQIEIEHLADNIKVSKDKIKKIVLVGHTDDVGATSYNKTLGQNRVDFVIAELIRLGVDKELLEGRSAGETQLLKQRKDMSGMEEDIETYRKRLRRVELSKIMNSK